MQLRDVLTPVTPQDLFLFSYPSPLLIIETDSTTDFLFTVSNLCVPSPYFVSTTVLIPEITSERLLWSVIVVLSVVLAKYFASVVNPATPAWPLVLYMTYSPFLNLW